MKQNTTNLKLFFLIKYKQNTMGNKCIEHKRNQYNEKSKLNEIAQIIIKNKLKYTNYLNDIVINKIKSKHSKK